MSQRFASLRGRLRELGFNQFFSEDSLELVESLFKAFVNVSEVAPA